MAAEIEKSFPDATVELIGGGKGDFIVKADDRLLWDKKGDQRRFPDEGEVVSKMG